MKKRLVSYLLITVLSFGGILGIAAFRNTDSIYNVHADKPEGLSSITFTLPKLAPMFIKQTGCMILAIF